MTDITISDASVEPITKAIAKASGCDKAVFSKCISAEETGIPCRCEKDARAALRAGLAAWPGMVHMPALKFNGLPPHMHRPEHIILPLTQEKTDD